MIAKLKEQINSCFVGKEKVVENVLICLIAGGHVLLEDVPGVGKTTLVRTLSAATGLDFGRIQFTPDTLPSDVVGVSVYNMKSGGFTYKEGAIMHSLLLADEINRTSPKTQASLLEAMAEGHVTVDGKSYELPQPFMVIATQNPVEYLGTYPLPEAQMDRFMMRLSIGYPEAEYELLMARNFIEGKRPELLESVCQKEEILQLRKKAEEVRFSDGVLSYLRDIVRLTREDGRFVVGASPRAMLHLLAAARTKAMFEGRDYAKPDDVKAVAVNVLHHRLVLTAEAGIHRDDVDSIVKSLVLKAKIPLE